MSSEPTSKPPKRTLLQKYEIPVEFLDFSYIKSCNDAKMIERIVKVLRSNEEGFYPELMKCAEEKLKELKPNSKMFRTETPAIKKEHLDDDQKIQIENDMKTFVDQMKQQDEMLKEIKPKENKNEPPIRKACQNTNQVSEKKIENRITSTDYTKWDKYDADAAELKIDLDAERQKEMVEAKNKKNIQKSKLIEVIEDDGMSEFEKDRMAVKFKERGNEAYKAKDYDEAIKEYTQSINIKPTAAAYNNRSLVHLKLKNYIKAISDANECLLMEPHNVKALIRKGQAFIGEKMLTEACNTFEKVLQLDTTNQIAQQEIIKIENKMPKRNTFRMKIEEIEEIKSDERKSEKLDIPESSHLPKLVQNILADEPSPFDKFKTKESKTRDKLLMPNDVQPSKNNTKMLIQEIN